MEQNTGRRESLWPHSWHYKTSTVEVGSFGRKRRNKREIRAGLGKTQLRENFGGR